MNQLENMSKLISEIDNCDVILELGANVGLITQTLILYNKNVHAFEPEPLAFEELKKIKSNNLIIVNKAAWIKSDKLKFYRSKAWDNLKKDVLLTTSSSLISSKTNVDLRNIIIVEAIDIVDYIERLNGRILIKMDVEGAEYFIINKLLKSKSIKNITKIFCEFHPNKIKYGRIHHIIIKLKIFFYKKSDLFAEWH